MQDDVYRTTPENPDAWNKSVLPMFFQEAARQLGKIQDGLVDASTQTESDVVDTNEGSEEDTNEGAEEDTNEGAEADTPVTENTKKKRKRKSNN